MVLRQVIKFWKFIFVSLTSIIKRLLDHRRKFEDYGTEQQVGSMGYQVYYS